MVAFIGSSGVGKSSLLNQLLGDERQTTKAIREEDGRGRHTTTSRQLFRLPNGAMVIDTPGMREISLETVAASSLDRHYQMIELLAEKCRFKIVVMNQSQIVQSKSVSFWRTLARSI